jgi:hypothetical protein
MRHTVWNGLNDLRSLVTGCGRGAGKHVQNKTECLETFRYSIVIENDKDQGYYFSEKLVDCLSLGTVPIMWGSGEHVKELFNAEGFMFWQTPEELHGILRALDTPAKQEKEYMKRIDAIRCNYKSALQFTTMIFDRFVRYVVGPNGGPNCNVCPV